MNFFWPLPGNDPSAQSNLLLKIADAGFDAVIINPMNGTNLLQGILKASEKRIPILDVGAKTDQRHFEKVPHSYIPIPTVDFLEQGRLGAEYIIRNLEPGRLSNVVILEGRPNSAQSIGRSNGALRIFEGQPQIRILARARADYEREKAFLAVKGLFEKGQTIDAFFCVNDLMALGVADVIAIERRKTKRKPIIVGVDLIDAAREAIRNGSIAASVAFSRSEVAASALDTAAAMMEDEKPPSASPVSSHLVSLQNLGKGMP
ncbi:conserved hypothetical protein [delta proteobacterium NaphS2]|nr:conserved hypothetical protein [delta proteobacterium NaphS2]